MTAWGLAVALAHAGGGEPLLAAAPQCDWPMYGREAGHSFAQTERCTGIAVETVATLAPKWFVPTADSVTASPAISGGTVFVGSWDGTFYALDAETGRERWRFSVDDGNRVGFGRIVSSAAVADSGGSTVVVFGGGATLYALDAATGAELARACVDPRADPPAPEPPVRCRGSEDDIQIESSPVVLPVDGEFRVLVGMDVHNDPGVGRTGLLSFRLEPGAPWRLEPLWKFDPETRLTYTRDAAQAGRPGAVVTDDPLTHDAGAGDGCGGVWSSPAVDAEAGLAFFGSASCSVAGGTGWDSMWAVDLASGLLAWSHSPRGGASLHDDDDFGSSPNLLPGGRVGQGSKDGRYYAFPRTTGPGGAGGWTARPAQSGHVFRDFSIGGIIGTPAVGSAAGRPAIFITSAFATPVDRPLDEGPPDRWPDRSLGEDPQRLFSLAALDAEDGRILWRSPLSRQSYGAPTYANGVVLVPSTFDLSIKAMHADTGVPLWEAQLNGAPSSAAAIVGDSIYLGTGTRQQGLEATSRLSGIWAFRLARGRLQP